MIHLLAGVACLGGNEGGSAFLIPFFRCRTSNRHFAQDLDSDRRIVAFKQFDPFHYRTFLDGLPAFERTVGDIGLMAIRLGDSIIVEEAPQLIERVRKLQLKSQKAPFFEIDACVLSGRTAGLTGAVRRAAKALGNNRLARSWERAELKVLSRATYHADQSDLEREYRHLTSAMDDPQWVRRWLVLRRHHPNSDLVVDLGLRYVLSPVPRITLRGRVMTQLVAGKQKLRMPAVIDAAQTWVSAAIELTPADPAIGRIWLALASLGTPLQGGMFDWGLKFVQASAWSDTPAAQWPDVWAALWHVSELARPDDRNHLRHLVHMALWDKRDSPRCTRLAVRALRGVALAPDISDILYSWVCAVQSHTNAWVDAFTLVTPDRLSEELVDAATLWLDTEPGRLRRWADVFETLITARPTDTELLAIGNDWLKRANPLLTSWPKVAQFIFPQSTDPEVELRVKRWIATHPEHPTAWELSLKITDLEERRMVHIQM